ncbi:hypothetical protein L6164_001660 [Bauhinia variegata]|uniref:Uncharacterized protein n=1 Tax=Bauhinia variegata TaxID=167791 RepID=A0ACB9QBK3_BAUVA|nr:hypothetical protein L6164_001660 [Bauhinia variegata]
MHNNEASSPSSNGGLGANTTTTTGQMQPNRSVFPGLYSPLYSDKPSFSAGSGISLHSFEGTSDFKYSDSASQSRLYDSCVIQKHQDMVNRQSICLSHLLETSKLEVDALRQENIHLRAVNRELNNQLNLVLQASVQNQFDGSSGHTTAFDIANGFRGLHIGDTREGKENFADWKDQEVSDESPTSVIESPVEVERFSLPKSISVRSNGYLKMTQTAASASNASRNKSATRPRTTPSPLDVHKVYVNGGKQEQEPLEMVVYNQGMFKTELCNKWQETGTCPYGDHCQFAHGIDELRPVIRHPRYKTEVCRMVLAGVICPYGHRCHFRHALTEQEKAMAQPKSRAMKLEK